MSSMPDRKQIFELIAVYRSLPALWDVKSPSYSSRQIKDEQFNILLLKYREIHPNADKADLRRRINLLRTCYRREYNRVRKRKNYPNGPYKPMLFYYDAFDSFLSPVESPPPVCSKCSLNECSVESVCLNSSLNVNETDQHQQPESKKRKHTSTDKLEKLPAERLTTPPDTSQQMANIWAHKLSKMNRMQRIIAEKVVNEVMFNGELGLLNTNTGLTNVGSMHETHLSPTHTEPKDEFITIVNNDIFGE